jgi:dethiobiotin synthetase
MKSQQQISYFLTGTDTDVGKTYITCLLLESLKKSGRSAVGYKPWCCGDRGDARRLLAAGTDGFTLDEINPVWLKTPASPYAAALIENRVLDFDSIIGAYHALSNRADAVIVEGVGGWEVPVTETQTAADLAQLLGLPVLVVVSNKLGALNHTILTVRNIQARGLHCAGLILNHVAEERDSASISNRIVLQRVLSEVPILADVMHGETELDAEFLFENAKENV